MKFFPLIWSAFTRRKARTVFTFLSVVVAFVLFSVLAAVHQGMVGQLSIANAQRLHVTAKASPGTPMPVHYREKIAQVPGVMAVSPMTGFHGHYRDPKNGLNVLFADPSTIGRIFPGFNTRHGRESAFGRGWMTDRQAAIAGPLLAARMGWHIGQTVPVQTNSPKQDGSTTWYFHLVGIYHADLPKAYQSFFIAHYQYFNQAVASPQLKDTAGQFFVRVDDARHISQIATAIDAQFAHSSPQTYTQSVRMQVLSYLHAFGDVGAIVVGVGVAVFFTLLLIVTNTMGQSIRERTAEFAVLKSFGFNRLRVAVLVLAEALLLTIVGGIVGIGIGYLVVGQLTPSLSNALQTFGLTSAAAASGVMLAIVFGLLASLVPVRQVTRLRTAAALAKR
ncbi:MAG TPA: ABC transporter permease [Gammaproteobacteria bacterium]|nr:ABC transporter permease [Gammaproteobacteria bacterium]